MPTQEEINTANVELQIANDNYAALADRYNNYMAAFQGYADASPEVKAKLQGTMERALADFEQLKLNMYAAEDRINQAQNAIAQLTQQPAVVNNGGQRRRVITPTNDQLRLGQYLDAGYVVGSDGLVYTPGGQLVNQNGYNINADGQFVPAQTVVDREQIPTGETPAALPPQLGATINKLSQSNQFVAPTPQINPAITTTSKPGTLTSGGSNRATVGEYLGNAWNGITQTYMNPNEIVYQSNSRLPGYNLGASLGRAGTVYSILAGGLGAAAPITATVPSTFAMPKYVGVPKVTTNIPKYVNALKTNPNVAALRRNVFVNTLR